jgi:hypothetical protein
LAARESAAKQVWAQQPQASVQIVNNHAAVSHFVAPNSRHPRGPTLALGFSCITI